MPPISVTDRVPIGEPFARFDQLLAAARALGSTVLPEPTAFTLATVGADGQPSARIVLLKGVDARGFVFYTNYESRKGRELLAHPQVAMVFHWQPLERQVRVEGTARPVSPEEADAYFASRARGSQLGAWASQQSQLVITAGDLEARFQEMEARFADKPVPRPPHWSGFRVSPIRLEFWRGMPSRLHERDLYHREADGWRVERLYP
jgi:pyridoxamine 5'-phosphate oxidase